MQGQGSLHVPCVWQPGPCKQIHKEEYHTDPWLSITALAVATAAAGEAEEGQEDGDTCSHTSLPLHLLDFIFICPQSQHNQVLLYARAVCGTGTDISKRSSLCVCHS